MTLLKRLCIPFCLLIMLPANAQKPDPVYKDASAPVDQRVEDLLSRMTLEEKTAQLQNRFFNDGDHSNLSKDFNGISYGTIHSMNANAEQMRSIVNRVQRYLRDSTRLGIPAIPTAEGVQGLLQDSCTIFPHSLALGSCFNPELAERMAAACAEEAQYMGIRQVLSPVLDIARDPRWGRVEETYGEDPYLIAEYGTAFVKGYQDNGVACTVKHFVAHGSPTGGLNCSSVSGGERELRNLYMYPFARVIAEASPYCVMSCYSSYDGVAVTGSRRYMTDLLRGELDFKGYTYGDWGAVGRLYDYNKVAADLEEAARMAIKAGVGLDVMGAYGSLAKQVEDGLVDISYIDDAVRAILRVKFQLGLFDTDFGSASAAGNKKARKSKTVAAPSPVRSEKHLALSKEISDESLVLMENNGILPLDLTKIKKIALVGPNSNQTIFGDYSWPDAFAKEGINLLEGLQMRLPAGVSVSQTDGCDWWSQDTSKIAEAVRLASESDIVVAAVGSRSTFLARKSLYNTAGEGNDLSSLDLPGSQQRLLEALKATGKPLVVVLISGKPFAMPWVKDNADAFLVQWYGGEQQGLTVADVLLGNVNPSGKLNISFPRSTGNIPCYYNYYPGDREYYGGHGGTPEKPAERYVFEKPGALWNFGHGLSYSSFTGKNFNLDKEQYSPADTIKAEIEVSNESGVDGKEVVQIYVHDVVSSVAVPVQQLKAFKKVLVKAGETLKVSLEIPVSELAFYNADLQKVVEPGDFEIQAGDASDNIWFTKTIKVK